MNNKSWKRGIGWYLAAVLASVAVLTGCGNAVGQNAKKEDDAALPDLPLHTGCKLQPDSHYL